MELIFATGNAHKIHEASGILGPSYILHSPAEYGLTNDIPETGTTLEENSSQKAVFIHDRLHCACFADDSGLEVDALDGAPGVYTARYAAGDTRFKDNLDKLLWALSGIEDPSRRTARFHTVVTLFCDESDSPVRFQGYCEGRIGFERKGCGGFGYDPIFIPAEIPLHRADGSWTLVPNTEGLAMAQLPDGDKNHISHRGRALRAMAEYLASKK